jgi:D-serine deaminase-like pyridoxal phosphate-dependent protein
MIKQPTLLLDKKRCLRNIRKMLDKAKANNIPLRPHFKTPQSQTIGRWFRKMGVHQITVSSLRMAKYCLFILV